MRVCFERCFGYFRYTQCDKYIRELEEGKLQSQPGCSPEETLEVCFISSVLCSPVSVVSVEIMICRFTYLSFCFSLLS